MSNMTRDDFKKAITERVFLRSTPEAPIVARSPNEHRESPWFFDFRSVIFEPEWLNYFAEEFWRRYEKEYPFQVGGLESASLPLITAITLKGLERKKPVRGFFIRKSRKRDGLLRMFEGALGDEPVIIVDDAINSGQSLYREMLALFELKKKVTSVFVILQFRDTAAYTLLHKHAINIDSLFTLEDFGLPLVPLTPEVPQEHFEPLWRTKVGKPSFDFVLEKSAPAIDAERLYVGTDNGFLCALSQETGEVLWKFQIGPHPAGKGVFSSPALHSGRVYFGAYDGNVYALDARTGERVWGFAEADWVGSSPAIAPDLRLLFIGTEFSLPLRHGGIVALNLDTGKKAWGHRMRDFTHSSPLYIKKEDLVVVGSNDGVAYAYEAATGTMRWKHATGGAIKSSFAYDEKRRLILFGSWDGHLYAVRAEDGSRVFSFPTSTPTFSTPLVNKDTVYFCSLDKFLYAISLDSGIPQWHFQTRGRIFASPVLADNSLWIGSNDACLYELAPQTGVLRSSFQLTERIVNAITYNERTERLFVPTIANEIHCIKRKNTSTL